MKNKWQIDEFGNYVRRIGKINMEILPSPRSYQVCVKSRSMSKVYLNCTSLITAKRKARQIYNEWFKELEDIKKGKV